MKSRHVEIGIALLVLFSAGIAFADGIVQSHRSGCACSGCCGTLQVFRPPIQPGFGLGGVATPVTAPIGGDSNVNTPTGFDITINFQGGLTPTQQAVFSSAEQTWESRLTGYQTGISLTGITINAIGQPIDGVGGILGQAGPTYGINEGGYALATQGLMQFDSDDLANMESNGTLEDVILHEMAHVMGFGILWDGPSIHPAFAGTQVVSQSGTGTYVGANAVAAYRLEYDQPDATHVPVELGGGAGTANSHWDEPDFGLGNAGISNEAGDDFSNELMTGWINVPNVMSETTLQSFADIGFTVASSSSQSAVPEPSAFLFMCIIGLGVGATSSVRRYCRLS